MLEIIGLGGGYDGKNVLEDISVRFESGSISSVIGANGCGKSTLLQMCCGLLKPSCGKVLIDGKDISKMKHSELAQKVSYMEQVHNPGNITVRALVSHGRFPYLGYPRRFTARDREMVGNAMLAAGVTEIADRNVAELSGGQRQRAYIAMALAQDTDIVLLDEPSTYLDISSQFELMELAADMKRSGKTVVMVLHDLNMALSHSDIAAVMKDGRLLGAVSPKEAAENGLIREALDITAIYDEKSGQYLFFGKDKKI
ncbi:MAG: ABC transporter ATP-binding protein [Oscillospiraceae bacterium]